MRMLGIAAGRINDRAGLNARAVVSVPRTRNTNIVSRSPARRYTVNIAADNAARRATRTCGIADIAVTVFRMGMLGILTAGRRMRMLLGITA